jgi:hypothetical protein
VRNPKKKTAVPAVTEKADELIPVHVTPTVKQLLLEKAEEQGLKLGPYCRSVLKRHASER